MTTRAEAIRAISAAFSVVQGEACSLDEESAILQDEIDALHALGVTQEEYEAALS